MNYYFKEFIRNINSNWKYCTIVILELAACALMTYIVLINFYEVNIRSEAYISGIHGKRYYNILVSDDGYDTITANSKLQNQIPMLSEEIDKFDGWTAYSYMISAIGLPKDDRGNKTISESFEQGYEEDVISDDNSDTQYLKSFMFSEEVFSAFNITLSEGRFFNGDEYTLDLSKGDSSAVILGAEYKKLYALGDTIHVLGNSENTQLYVIGFLNSGTSFSTPEYYESLTLDRYMILPQYSKIIAKDGTIVSDFSHDKSQLLISGAIAVDDPTLNVQEEMNRITNSYGFPNIECIQWGGEFYESAQNASRRNAFIISAITLTLFCIAIASLTYIYIRKAEANTRVYAVYMHVGIQPRSIQISVIIESIVYTLLAVLPVIWLSNLKFRTMVFPVYMLILTIIPLMLIPTIAVIRYITNIKLTQLSGE